MSNHCAVHHKSRSVSLSAHVKPPQWQRSGINCERAESFLYFDCITSMFGSHSDSQIIFDQFIFRSSLFGMIDFSCRFIISFHQNVDLQCNKPFSLVCHIELRHVCVCICFFSVHSSLLPVHNIADVCHCIDDNCQTLCVLIKTCVLIKSVF